MSATRPYAQGTRVPVRQSKDELERLLERYGADEFASGWDTGNQVIAFRYNSLTIRFKIPKSDDEREDRRRWRVLVLVVKAKLEAIATDVSTFEQEFLAWVVGPGGVTLGDRFIPQLENLEELPRLLPAAC